MKKFLIFLASLSLMISVTACGTKTETKQDEKKEEIKNDGVVIKEKEVDGLVFSPASIVFDEKEKISTVTFSVTNKNEEEYNLGYFDIVLLDDEGKDIIQVTVAPNKIVLEKGETTMVNTQFPEDVRRAVDFEYKKNK